VNFRNKVWTQRFVCRAPAAPARQSVCINFDRRNGPASAAERGCFVANEAAKNRPSAAPKPASAMFQGASESSIRYSACAQQNRNF
jgi:hypothetical protein